MSRRTDVSRQPDEPPADVLAKAAGALRRPLANCLDDAGDGSAGEITGIVLGSGLGALAERIDRATAVPFDRIPGFARSTAAGHRGELIFGRLVGRPVIAMAGRFHRYEGWSNEQVAFPIRVMRALGAKCLVASNAAGGVNPKLNVGDLVVIRDHINWLHARSVAAPEVPPRGETAAATGIFRSGLIYDASMADLALAEARSGGFTAIQGTYLATLGPTYETRAEYRMMRRMGADVVGMSTVGEVLVAAALGMRVLALSVVSNVADPDRAKVADHAEVLEAGDAAAAKLERIVNRVLGGHESMDDG